MDLLFAKLESASLPLANISTANISLALGWILSLAVVVFLMVSAIFVTLEFMRQNVLRPGIAMSRYSQPEARQNLMPSERAFAQERAPEYGETMERWRSHYEEWKRF